MTNGRTNKRTEGQCHLELLIAAKNTNLGFWFNLQILNPSTVDFRCQGMISTTSLFLYFTAYRVLQFFKGVEHYRHRPFPLISLVESPS